MSNRQLFSAVTRQLGRTRGHLGRQSTPSLAEVSWPVSSPVSSSDRRLTMDVRDSSCFALNNSACRQFSDMPLRRPPKHKKKGLGNNNSNNSDTNQKWRSHAVSLGFGNYYDDFEDDTSAVANAMESADPARASMPSAWDEEESELAEQVQEIQREDDERRQRWLENAKPPVRESIVDERGRAYGRGGRKMASARVWIQPGFGNVVVNKKEFVDYFDRTSDRELILEPLAATETLGRFDITVTVEGGGLRGQAGAIRHGLARALNHYNPDTYRPPLKRLGYLTRDPRRVERKKVGHLKARKKPQWVKR